MPKTRNSINLKLPDIWVLDDSYTESEKLASLSSFCFRRAESLFWLINNLGHAIQAGHENFNYSELGENLMFIGEIGKAMIDEGCEYVGKLESLKNKSGGQK